MSKDMYYLKDYATEIFPNLWVGERFACKWAQNLGFRTICVLENPCLNIDCIHCRILPTEDRPVYMDAYAGLQRQVDPKALQDAIKTIDSLYGSTPLLVHCGAGIERSPLTVAVWISQNQNIHIESAYKMIKDKRHIVEDRQQWLKQYK